MRADCVSAADHCTLAGAAMGLRNRAGATLSWTGGWAAGDCAAVAAAGTARLSAVAGLKVRAWRLTVGFAVCV